MIEQSSGQTKKGSDKISQRTHWALQPHCNVCALLITMTILDLLDYGATVSGKQIPKDISKSYLLCN